MFSTRECSCGTSPKKYVLDLTASICAIDDRREHRGLAKREGGAGGVEVSSYRHPYVSHTSCGEKTVQACLLACGVHRSPIATTCVQCCFVSVSAALLACHGGIGIASRGLPKALNTQAPRVSTREQSSSTTTSGHLLATPPRREKVSTQSTGSDLHKRDSTHHRFTLDRAKARALWWRQLHIIDIPRRRHTKAFFRAFLRCHHTLLHLLARSDGGTRARGYKRHYARNARVARRPHLFH